MITVYGKPLLKGQIQVNKNSSSQKKLKKPIEIDIYFSSRNLLHFLASSQECGGTTRSGLLLLLLLLHQSAAVFCCCFTRFIFTCTYCLWTGWAEARYIQGRLLDALDLLSTPPAAGHSVLVFQLMLQQALVNTIFL